MLMAQDITARLDEYLETEFSFIRSDELVPLILALVPAEQDFVLDWTRRIASTHTEIAHQFLRRATQALVAHEARIIEAWALHAMDVYDRAGLRDALAVIADIDHFVHYSHVRTAGVLFDEVSGVLQHFVHGLPGRALKLSMGDVSWTDGETIHLPAVMAQLDNKEANFQLCKLMVVMQWAQIHHGTIYTELTADLSVWPDLARAVKIYSLLESLRLESIIARALPGLGRQMEQLEADYISALPANWQDAAKSLQARGATAATSQTLLPSFYKFDLPVARLWHCDLDLEALDACRQARITREKHKLRVQLAQWLAELRRKKPAMNKTVKLAVQQPDENSDYNGPLELTINEAPVIPPRIVQQLLGSIQLDFGGIPPEYLVAAGPGEYDTDEQTTEAEAEDPDAVWQGTYHEHGALYYNEWDYGRRHYRKNWCVMREKDVVPVYDNFVSDTLRRCSGLVAHLRRSFEAMRDDERLLKRQTEGENVDIDALVEALADARDGREMSERLFVRQHRVERDITVAFMVDMSGSTQGWINEAERESLLLLCEALEMLGDRYAIYGFSGITRKRCELYRIKRFDESYGDEVRARISGIRAQDYTRMGFAIRHLSGLLNDTGARTRLLVTLSDGKPDDYSDYRGEYGIEDTRQALLEARRSGIHAFCITIDEQGPAYLPHMYGAANYTVVAEVRQLPFRVADIYRRLTR
ncbi:MAG: VWA domain-containing protein [Thiohalomonadaceae bacterium]